MKRARIPLFDISLNPETIKLVNKTLRSGWINTGPVVETLEQRLKRFLGVSHVAAVNSATSGLELALRSFGVGAKAELITTPLTFVATAEVILRLGAKPVFADIDPLTLTLDPVSVSRKITARTATIMPVDLAGHPSDYTALRRVARSAGLPVISDASHALGALYRGKSIGAWADATIYSFQSTKNLTTAEGGLVVARTNKAIETVRLTSKHGMSQNAYERKKSREFGYDVSVLGMKANLPDILAAIGLGQLKSLAGDQIKRERIAARYCHNLSDLSDLCKLPFVASNCNHAWHLYIIRLNLAALRIDRNRFIRLMAERRIECGVHYRPLFDLSYYRKLGYSGKSLPVATAAGKQVVSLPLFPSLRLGEVDYISQCVSEILARYRR